MSRDDRKRPWRKLRVVVEVTVPPQSRATEKDLKYLVEQATPEILGLPRPNRPDTRKAAVRVKAFSPFIKMYQVKERAKRNASRD